MARKQTYIDVLEAVVEDVGKWGAQQVELVIQALAPDGRAFGDKKLTRREQLYVYMTKYRGRKEAWDEWIEQRVQRVMNELTQAGVPEQDALAIHPYNLAQVAALKYSIEMEKLLTEETNKAMAEMESTAQRRWDETATQERAALRPTAPIMAPPSQGPLGQAVGNGFQALG